MLDKETTKRLMLNRVWEWDTEVSPAHYFDVLRLNAVSEAAASRRAMALLRRSPEAGLDHGGPACVLSVGSGIEPNTAVWTIGRVLENMEYYNDLVCNKVELAQQLEVKWEAIVMMTELQGGRFSDSKSN